MNMNDSFKIMILTTGGTIEKIYNENDGSLTNNDSIIKQRFIEKLRLPYTDIDVKSIMAKDSLYMDDNDRQEVLVQIKKYEDLKNPIVILHGTDTMEVTARHCFLHHKNIKVPVIFTGAMRPLEMSDSDAKQNVLEALFAAKLVKPGYYISFHNRLFDVPNVRKNRLLGTFEAF